MNSYLRLSTGLPSRGKTCRANFYAAASAFHFIGNSLHSGFAVAGAIIAAELRFEVPGS